MRSSCEYLHGLIAQYSMYLPCDVTHLDCSQKALRCSNDDDYAMKYKFSVVFILLFLIRAVLHTRLNIRKIRSYDDSSNFFCMICGLMNSCCLSWARLRYLAPWICPRQFCDRNFD